MKRVLILCTGNSCRSIIAEGLINKYLSHKNIEAFSAGSKPVGYVNENTKKVLEMEGAWRKVYHSKTIESIEKFSPFELVITVCDGAKESCPSYPNTKKQIHIPFNDPAGQPFEEFERVNDEVKRKLLPEVERILVDIL